jgi:acetyl-CoA C-acetyltransferase
VAGAVSDPRGACLIGVAQRTWRPEAGHHPQEVPEPLAMAEEVVRSAVADARASGDVLGSVQSLNWVYCMSWPYDDPVGRLAERLGVAPAHRATSGMSGTSAQSLALEAARRIAAGELEVAVVAGAEALATKRALKRAGERPAWSHRAEGRELPPFEWPFHPAEVAHEVFQAYLTFALRDNARSAHRGTTTAQRREEIGDLLAPMTLVAAANPHAWDPTARPAHELVDVAPGNRMVATPYPKRTIAQMDVDMAAAIVVASVEAADHLGVPEERRVHLRGWAEADDAHYVAEHPDLWRSPAMEWCARHALAGAGAIPDDLAHLDLYSCFASSIDFALDALATPASELGGRDVTVTGGLPYAGGPACNYLAHSLASMAWRLRRDPGSLGLTTGVGMHMTKHSWAVWSTEPGDVLPPPAPPLAKSIPIVEGWQGDATLATCSVLHDRAGDPVRGVGIADVDGGRIYLTTDDPEVLQRWSGDAWRGDVVRVRVVDGAHLISP